MFGKKRTNRSVRTEYPGGHPASMTTPGMLFSSRDVPLESHEQAAVALGIATFDMPLLINEQPSRSPVLDFKATEEAIWTYNPDGTLYDHSAWDAAHSFTLDKGGDVLVLTGLFVRTQFSRLSLEPMPQYRQEATELVASKVPAA